MNISNIVRSFRWMIGGLFLLSGMLTPIVIRPFVIYGPLIFFYSFFAFLAGMLIVPDIFTKYIQPKLSIRLTRWHKIGLVILSLVIANGFASFSTDNAKCADGTAVDTCSQNKPDYCNSFGVLISYPEKCGNCSDGTKLGECSNQKPLFCEEGTLVKNEVKCGCQNGEYYSTVYGCSGLVNVSYDELFRHNEDYIGRILQYDAEVEQIIGQNQKIQDLRVDVSRNYFHSEIIYVKSYSGGRLLEGDRVEIIGEVGGLITYESILHTSVTIPEIRAINVSLKQ